MSPMLPNGVRRLFRLSLRRPDLIHEAMDEELRFHIDERVAQLTARGMSPAEARAEAVRRLGPSLTEVTRRLHSSAERKERSLAMHELIEEFLSDCRYALRGLARRPAFTLLAVSTLAIGIGANTAIFSAVNAMLLRSLPFHAPNELMDIVLVAPANEARATPADNPWSWPKFVYYRQQQHSHAELALYSAGNFIVGTATSERVPGELISARYLATLGIVPAVGQDLPTSEDIGPGAPSLALISDQLWRRRFNADPTLIGQTINIDGQPFTVQGVLPTGFRGLTGRADVMIPIATRSAEDLAQNWSLEFSMVGRLRPGVSPAAARSEAELLGPRIYDASPMTESNLGPGAKGGWGASAHPLDGLRVSPGVRQSLLVLFGAVGFVLLIACVNLANFLLGRATARRREIGIRLAIGASRARLVRLLLAESFVLALLGGAASLLVAWLGTRLLQAANPLETLRVQGLSGLGIVGFADVGIDSHALLFTLVTTLVVALVFGLAPALQSTRPSLTESLKEGTSPTPQRGFRFGISRGTLVVVEVALAVVLLAGSGLMLRSLGKLLAIDPGFDAEHVLTMRLGMIPGQIPRDSMPGFYDRLVAQLAAIPGVTNVGLADCPPLNGGCNGTIITFPDRPAVKGVEAPGIGVHVVTKGWFGALRVPLLRGRLFTDADHIGTEKVILVSELAARKHWPGQDPIGKRANIYQGGFHDGATVIGVVGEVRYSTVDSVPVPEVYMPYTQAPRTSLMIFIRGRGDAASLAPAARRVLADLAPAYPVYDLQPMSSRVAAATGQSRFIATLLALFAMVALSLALMGIYGVMSFAVQQRTREIGIRMALGAEPGAVLRQVISEGATLAAVGALIGVGAALLLTRVMRALLYDVESSDPLVYLAIVVVLGAAALLASWLPARRASQVDPVEALRLG
ncbi:MAG: ABC transporter permease [Gemmatimonadota bacterium]